MTDWIRGSEGPPKKMPNGSYVLIKDGVCFAVRHGDIDRIYDLLDELDLTPSRMLSHESSL